MTTPLERRTRRAQRWLNWRNDSPMRVPPDQSFTAADTFSSATTASSNLAIGLNAFEDQATGNGNCVVGIGTARNANAANDCTLIGNIVAENAVNGGTGLTSVGFRAQQFATAMRNNATLGDSTLWRSQGDRCVAIGYRTAEYNGSGDDCIYIGSAAEAHH